MGVFFFLIHGPASKIKKKKTIEENKTKKSKEEQLLMKRLLQSMHIPLENLGSFNALLKNVAAQNWLQERVKEVGLNHIETRNGKQPSVKIFSLLSNPHGSKIKKQKFNCSIIRNGQSLAGIFDGKSEKLNEYFDVDNIVDKVIDQIEITRK